MELQCWKNKLTSKQFIKKNNANLFIVIKNVSSKFIHHLWLVWCNGIEQELLLNHKEDLLTCWTDLFIHSSPILFNTINRFLMNELQIIVSNVLFNTASKKCKYVVLDGLPSSKDFIDNVSATVLHQLNAFIALPWSRLQWSSRVSLY